MMRCGNRLDGSGEGWSTGHSSPDGPGWMAAEFSRKICLFACLALGILALGLVAPAAAKNVDAASARASLSLASKGAAAMERGDFLAAQRLYETSVVANPANAAAFTGLGTAHEARGQARLARKYYNIALSIEPSDISALSRLAQLDLKEGNRAAATEGLRKLRAFCAACGETQELSRALGLGPQDPIPASTDP